MIRSIVSSLVKSSRSGLGFLSASSRGLSFRPNQKDRDSQSMKQKLNETKDNLKDKFNEAKDTVKDKVSDAKEGIKEKASDFKETVKDTAESVKEKAQDLGKGMKDTKDSIKQKMGGSRENEKAEGSKQVQAQSSSEALENLKKKGWSVKTSGSRVELDKRIEDADVHISFYAKPQSPEKTSGSESDKDGKEKEPEYSQFTVQIKRPETGEYLYADYMSREGAVTLGNVNFTKNGGSHKLLNRLQRYNQRRHQQKNWSPYQRFAFDPIDEQLFRSMERYFDSMGVDRDLFRTIQSYSVSVEPSMVSKWMDDLKSFMKRF